MPDALHAIPSDRPVDDVASHGLRWLTWWQTTQRRATNLRRDWLRKTPDERLTLASRYLPFWVSLVLALAIGYHLVKLVIALTPTPIQAWVPPEVPKAPGPLPSLGAASTVIATAHLFGVVPAVDELPAQDVAAPETTLSLELRGLVVSSDPNTSHAIIADGTGSESVYFLQSELPGGAIVVAIQANRVMLKRAGVLEALLLPRLSEGAPDGSPAYALASDTGGGGGEQAAIPEALPEPKVARLADIMMPRPRIKDGQFRGVEVYPGERDEAFAGLGLIPGDLITAIDGRPLSASDAAAPFQGMAESATLTLTISRRGQTRTIKLANGKLVVPPPSTT